jgi:hypothetical protein
MNRAGRAIRMFLLAGAAALALPTAAGAAIASSQITSPPGPDFAIADEDSPGTIAVSGTSNGSAGEKADLDCIYRAGGFRVDAKLAAEVPLEAGGAFSEPAAELAGAVEHVCRLRAVPAGTEPEPASAFAGPVLAVGTHGTETVPGGPNAGTVTTYRIWGQQLTAADFYKGAGTCGIYDAFLFDPSFENTTTTFYCNDHWRYYNAFPESSSSRSELQVDGVNAYLPGSAEEIDEDAHDLPALTYSYSQNPLNGDLTIHESDPVVKCPDPEYPPSESSCPSFEGAGVRDDRTIEQTEDGHLVTIADRFVSVDGQPHSLDLLPQNNQSFDSHGESVAYRFPGESSYSTHEMGDGVSFDDEPPGAVFAKVEGSTDGDTSTGRGAIVFDRPASPATFNRVNPSESDLYFHQTAYVPAAGSARIRFAYVQAYTQAEVDALAEQAEDAFTVPTFPLSPVARFPAQAPLPSNRFQLRRVKLNRRNGTAKLYVKVPGPGTVVVGGHKVRRGQRKSVGAGVVSLNLTPKRRFAKRLRRRGRLKVSFKIAFTPTGGRTRATHRGLKLRERRRHHGG